MKFVYTRDENGSLTVTRTYEPGETYMSSYKWDRKLGKPTRELVEQMFEGCRFVQTFVDTMTDPFTFRNKSVTRVLVERVAA